jgi:hypothetical protein
VSAYEQGFAKGVEYACLELKLRSQRRRLPLAIMLQAAFNMGKTLNTPDSERSHE